MSAPDLTVVVPIYNEQASLPELVRRCADNARAVARSPEVLIVDDHSTDETPQVLAELGHDEPALRVIRLPGNRGQFRAVQAGLAAARAAEIIVMDGDLQDPPELFPALLDRLHAEPDESTVAFATKRSRKEPLWFIAGQRAYRFVAQHLAAVAPPATSGSFCALRSGMAQRAAALPIEDANLAAALAALGARPAAVPYDREARRDGKSRVGLVGLSREAAGSLALLGALERLLAAVAFSTAAIAVACARANWLLGASAAGLAIALLLGAARLRLWRRRLISTAANPAVPGRSSAELHSGLPMLAASALALPAANGSTSHGPGVPMVDLVVLFAAVWTVVVLARYRRRETGLVIVVSLLVVATAVGLAWLIQPSAIDARLITVLQEGNTRRDVLQLYARTTHAGADFHALVQALSGRSVATLRDVIRLNLVLAGVNTVLVGGVAWSVMESRVAAVLLTLVAAIVPTSVVGALSEQPAELATLYLLLGAVALAALRSCCEQPRARAGVGPLLLLASVTLAAVRLRTELAVVAIPAALVALLEWAFGAEQIDRTMRSAVSRTLAWARTHKKAAIAVVVVLVLLARPRFLEQFWPGSWSSMVALTALSPFNPSVLGFPALLLDLLPVGLVVLALAGVGFGLTRLQRFAFLPLSVLLLFRAYNSAAHMGAVYFELFRYLTMVVPGMILLALFGWSGITRLWARLGWSSTSRRVLLYVVIGGFFAPPGLYGARGPGSEWPHPDALVRSGLMSRNNQVEVRYLLAALDHHPACTFVTRSAEREHHGRRQLTNAYLVFGKPGAVPYHKTNTYADALRIARASNPSECLLFFQSVDCNVAGGNRCSAEISGATRIDQRTLTSRPYSNPEEYRPIRGEIHLGLFALDPSPRGNGRTAAGG